MTKIVTAAEANRQFSSLLRDVSGGETIVVTSHGRPVARIVPIEDVDSEEYRRKARAMDSFLSLARAQPAREIPKWSRDELYEDEPYPDTFK